MRERYGVAPSTLRSWANPGMLRCVRTPGGKRLYDSEQLRRLLSDREDPSTGSIIYARVSSSKQRADLQRQVNELTQAQENCPFGRVHQNFTGDVFGILCV